MHVFGNQSRFFVLAMSATGCNSDETETPSPFTDGVCETEPADGAWTAPTDGNVIDWIDVGEDTEDPPKTGYQFFPSSPGVECGACGPPTHLSGR